MVLSLRLGTSSSSSPSKFWNETVVEGRRLSPPSNEAGLLDVHIPKSGGSSLMRLWGAIAQSRDYCALEKFVTHIPRRNIGTCAEGARARVLSGHTSLNLEATLEVLSVPRVLTVLVLREPLSRLVSYANYQNVRLEQFEEPSLRWIPGMGSNSMTKFVNGVEGTGPYTKGRHRVKGMCEYDKSIAIKTARNRLLNVVTVFGVTKYFIETVWLFGKTFDWPQSLITTPFEKSWHGFCDKKVEESECGKWKFSVADLKNETVARVREHERCDFELYQTGLDIFMSRLDAASREDKEDLKKFKASVLLMKNLSATKQNS